MERLPMLVGLEGVKVPFLGKRQELMAHLLSSGCEVVLEGTVRIAQCNSW